MKLEDLYLSDERKKYLKNMCEYFNALRVTISDGDWKLTCAEIHEINQKNIYRLWEKNC